MENLLYIVIGIFGALAVLFFKNKSKDSSSTTRKEEKAILKDLKKKEKENEEISKQHGEILSKTSQDVNRLANSHDERKNDMKHLYREKD